MFSYFCSLLLDRRLDFLLQEGNPSLVLSAKLRGCYSFSVFVRNVFILLSLLKGVLGERQLRLTSIFCHHLEDVMIALSLGRRCCCWVLWWRHG